MGASPSCKEIAVFQRILVPTDGSPRSDRAVKAAAKLARRTHGSITIFHAVPAYVSPYYSDGFILDWPDEGHYRKQASAAAKKLLDKAKALAIQSKVPAFTLEGYSSDPAAAILAAASKSKADAILMASHGRKGLEKLILGSETQKVLARSRLPVVVIR
jgi:nucleotide-binding universal stress UspA family protein